MTKPIIPIQADRYINVSYEEVNEARFIISVDNSRLKIPLHTSGKNLNHYLAWAKEIQIELAPKFRKAFIGNFHVKDGNVRISMQVRVSERKKQTVKEYNFKDILE
jgi:hypothetical protein